MKKFILFCLLLSFQCILSQNTLMGKVVNSKDKAIKNAQIYLDTTYANVTTNDRGFFEVVIPEGVKEIHVYTKKEGLLSAVYNGEPFLKFVYLTKSGKNKVAEEDDEKQVVGYGKVPEDDVAYSISKVETNGQDQTYGFNNIFDLIRARVAGVRVTNDNRIFIRGGNSIRSTQQPLFVLDGNVVSSISWISPIDVKEISVLKDGSGSIYGSRGANGVIIIETRK
jgi:TonB-dependent SusC/RagA subfamily outer membrane receptor